MLVANLTIVKGKTFSQKVRWESAPILYKPITGITQTAPVTITCNNHVVPDGWRVAIVSVKGMTEINASSTPPKDKDYYEATVKSVSSIELNEINAAQYSAYVSGGYIQYNTPVDLTGYTARMSIKDSATPKAGAAELLRLDTTNGGIVVNNTTKTITLNITATATAALTFTKGFYDVEMVSVTGEVFLLMSGTVTVQSEITST
jgi:hypothetical protein